MRSDRITGLKANPNQGNKLLALLARLQATAVFRTEPRKGSRGSSGRLGMTLGGGPLLNVKKDGGGRQIERVQGEI